LTAAALHLLTVGGLLLFIAIVQVRRPRPIQQNRRRRRSIVVDDDSSFSSSSNDNEEGYEANATSSLSLRDKLRNCAAVGLAFGAKYVVGHWALQLTPSLIYELFHSINILFIALFARLLLNERLTTCEVICCIGIVVGSFTMVGLGGWEGIMKERRML
jgi:drug/metabolite transporter (DMT)-like permease